MNDESLMTKDAPSSSEHSDLLGHSSLVLRHFLASFQIEFAGSEDGDRVHALHLFWNPQIRDTGFAKFVAQLGEIDIYCAEQHKRFALGFVLHSHDGDWSFIASGQAKKIGNSPFNRFVRHHFAAHL